MPKQLTQSIVEQWVSMATGAFTLFDVGRELNIQTDEGRNYLRVVMHRLVKLGLVETVGKKDGVFRPVDKSKKEIDLTNIDPNATIPLMLPFGIHEYVEFYAKNIVLVAGETNAGKTCFLYNTAVMNMDLFKTDFYTNNEATPQEIIKRLSHLDTPIPPPFKIFERYDNYADVIDPNNLTIIDYLDMNSEVYLAGEEIERVHQKLQNGIAVIGMQLPPPVKTINRGKEELHHRSLAYGGAFTIKKPVLYLNLWMNGTENGGICRIEKAKNRAQPRINPNNMQWQYTIDAYGAQFIKYERYYPENKMGF